MNNNNNSNNDDDGGGGGCARNLVAEAIDGIVFPKLDASAHCWKVNCKYTVSTRNKQQQQQQQQASTADEEPIGHLPFILK